MKKAPAATIKKIRKMVSEGKMAVDLPDKLEVPVKVGKWEFAACTIGDTWRNARGEGFVIRWAIKGLGFGNLTFVRRPDGRVECDNECMSREFVLACLTALVLRCKFYDETVQ